MTDALVVSTMTVPPSPIGGRPLADLGGWWIPFSPAETRAKTPTVSARVPDEAVLPTAIFRDLPYWISIVYTVDVPIVSHSSHSYSTVIIVYCGRINMG